MKKKSSPVPIIIGMLILILVVSGVYFAALKIKEKKNSEKADISFTETDVLLGINLEEDYPLTSREVIKLYSRINICLYNDTDISAEDFEELVKMQRALYDDELLAINPENSHIMALMAEASKYVEENKRISDYEIATVSNIESWKDEGKSYASMTARYIIIEGGVSSNVYHKFLLRYDDTTSRWKILGWEAASKDDMK